MDEQADNKSRTREGEDGKSYLEIVFPESGTEIQDSILIKDRDGRRVVIVGKPKTQGVTLKDESSRKAALVLSYPGVRKDRSEDVKKLDQEYMDLLAVFNIESAHPDDIPKELIDLDKIKSIHLMWWIKNIHRILHYRHLDSLLSHLESSTVSNIFKHFTSPYKKMELIPFFHPYIHDQMFGFISDCITKGVFLESSSFMDVRARVIILSYFKHMIPLFDQSWLPGLGFLFNAICDTQMVSSPPLREDLLSMTVTANLIMRNVLTADGIVLALKSPILSKHTPKTYSSYSISDTSVWKRENVILTLLKKIDSSNIDISLIRDSLTPYKQHRKGWTSEAVSLVHKILNG